MSAELKIYIVCIDDKYDNLSYIQYISSSEEDAQEFIDRKEDMSDAIIITRYLQFDCKDAWLFHKLGAVLRSLGDDIAEAKEELAHVVGKVIERGRV